MHKDIGAEEVGLKILQVPKDRLRPTQKQKPKIEERGELQQDSPAPFALFSTAWKSTGTQSVSILDLSISWVPNREECGILEKTLVKGERALNGYRSYWLLENGQITKSVAAATDEEAKELLLD